VESCEFVSLRNIKQGTGDDHYLIKETGDSSGTLVYRHDEEQWKTDEEVRACVRVREFDAFIHPVYCTWSVRLKTSGVSIAEASDLGEVPPNHAGWCASCA
jgi:hypothetical protein